MIVLLVDEGVAKGRVCFTYGSNNCRWKQNIYIKNCGSYYVYQLPPPPDCPLRYCSGRYGEIEYEYIWFSDKSISVKMILLIYTWLMIVDYCKPNPCLHGSCHYIRRGFRCHCEPGYTAKYCEKGIMDYFKCFLCIIVFNIDVRSVNKSCSQSEIFYRIFLLLPAWHIWNIQDIFGNSS